MITKKDCPCRCCGERTATCHATCEPFREWDIAYREQREAVVWQKKIEREADRQRKMAVARYFNRMRRDGLSTK